MDYQSLITQLEEPTALPALAQSLDTAAAAKLVDHLKAEAARARAILMHHAVHEKRLVLDLNTAVVYGLLGNQRQALAQFQQALDTAEMLGDAGRDWLGPIYTNIGLTYEALGDLRCALTF